MFASANLPLAMLMLDLLVKVTLFVGLILLAARVLTGQSAALRHCIWLACFSGLLALPLATHLLPTYRLPIGASAWQFADAGMLTNAVSPQVDSTHGDINNMRAATSHEDIPSRVEFTSASLKAASEQSPNANLGLSARQQTSQDGGSGQWKVEMPWLTKSIQAGLAVWIVGFAFSLLRLFVGIWKSARVRHGSQLVADTSLRRELEQLTGAMQLRRHVVLRESNDRWVPMTWGVLRPAILLPSPGWRDWTTECRRVVLLHELAHVKRLDVLWQTFSRAVCSFYWFHPLVWYAYRQLRIERELACDDCVLSSGVKPSSYAQHLVCLAREFRMPTASMTVAMAQRSGLERRIRAILDHSGSRLPLTKLATRTTLLICLLVAVVLAIPKMSAGNAPQDDEKSKPNATASSTEPTLTESDKTAEEVVASDELVGIVVDAEGNPLADVLIDVWSWYPGNETRTDAAGRFRLKFDDARHKVELRVMKDGYSPFYNVQQPLGVRDFKVTLGQKTYIEGIVRDSTGVPVFNVEVRGEQGPQEADGAIIGFVVTKTQTDGQGRYRLYVHPDTYQLLVRTESGQVARLTEVVVQPDEAKHQDIDLQNGVHFEAQVIDSVSKQPFPDLVLFHFMHPGIVGRSDAQGKLVIDGMLPGEFEFNVGEGDAQKLGPFTGYLPRSIGRWWSPQASTKWGREDIEAGQFQRNLDDLKFDLAADMKPVTIFVEQGVTFSGQVTDPDGKPVEGATVAPAKTGSGNSLTGDTRYSVKTDADGRYEVVMPAGKEFEYNLIAHDGDYQQWRNWANAVTEPLRTQPGERIEDLNIQLTRPATVRGKIVAEGDRNLGGREVRAQAKDARENRYYDPTTTTNEDGSFELKFVRPGENYIQVEPFWLTATNAPEGSTDFVSLEPGQVVEGIELKVPASAQPAMPAAAQREFTILLQDENGVALPDMELILSGYGRQADFSALSGAPSKLAERWNSEPLGGDVRKTDAEGRLKFYGSEFFSEQAMALAVVAMDTEANRAAISCLYPDARETEITLTMQPLREIELTIDVAALGIADTDNDLLLVVGLAVESSMLFQQKLKGRELVFQIPPGNYKLFAIHPLSEPVNIPLEVKSDTLVDTAVQISLTLEPNRLTQMIGQDAPVLRDIVAWQGGEPTTLEELRGKVVVLDFWGYWCGPCLAAMPELMKLHDELHEQGLEIIAIHDSSMSSLDVLHQQLEPTRKKLWNDRDLPFRIALAGNGSDEQQTAQGTAIADYGIREFPTTLLVGRDGKVVQRIYPHQADENLRLIRNLLDQ